MVLFRKPTVNPDWEGLLRNIRREGTPKRVYFFEHGIDRSMQAALAERFDLWRTIPENYPHVAALRTMHVHHFLGMEMMRIFPPGGRILAPTVSGGWAQEHRGPIGSWAELETYPLKRAEDADLSVLDFLDREMPETMRAFHVVSVWEAARDLMGFEQICLNLIEQPDLVEALLERITLFLEAVLRPCCDHPSFGAVYVADDLGYKTALMLSPELIRRYILPRHQRLADLAHAKGKLFFLHSCGQVYELVNDFIQKLRLDVKHSFEDAVMPITEAKRRYGTQMSLLGGMDVDLLARADERTIRERTRHILEVCQPGGGFCLGSGNGVTSYIPLDNDLAMHDEARRRVH
jgi:uroporphyrinogen decarboxylase